MNDIQLRDRVKVQTATHGCYHGKKGTVNRILNGSMTPLDCIPNGSANQYPYWYQVQFDTPADNGGRLVHAEIFLASELVVLSHKSKEETS